MGEMADIANEGWADYGHLWFPAEPPPVTCKYCGKRNLKWSPTDKGYRLIDKTYAIHTCDKYRRH